MNEIDDDILDFIYEFANTYTEESVLHGFIEQQKEAEEEVSDDVLEELGY